jgi:hypothetical protein
LPPVLSRRYEDLASKTTAQDPDDAEIFLVEAPLHGESVRRFYDLPTWIVMMPKRPLREVMR